MFFVVIYVGLYLYLVIEFGVLFVGVVGGLLVLVNVFGVGL